MTRNSGLVAMALVMALAGCGGASEGDDETGDDSLASSEDGLTIAQAKLVGSWKQAAGQAGSYTDLVLFASTRFTAKAVVYCVRAPCLPVPISGTWTASTTKLTLTETTPSAESRPYTYALTGNHLILKGTHGMISGSLTRVSGANACATGGGRCTGLGPHGCGVGNQTGDANQFSCGGGLGVMCCLPK
jgi:hypothetical protein